MKRYNLIKKHLINKFSDNNPDVISDSIKLILNDGLSINSQDNFGNTPLHYAVRSSNLKAVEVLINNNANPNIVNIVNHSTPLHNAASIGNKSILKLLLDNGADPNIANDYGKKPFDYYLFFNKDIDGNIKQKLSYNYVTKDHVCFVVWSTFFTMVMCIR